MRRRLQTLLLWLVLAVALASCGAQGEDGTKTAAEPPRAGPIAVPGLGEAKRIEGFGHSYMGAAGLDPKDGFFSLVARHFRLTGGQAGGGGASVTEQLGDVYERNLKRHEADAAPQLGIVMWGLNDLAQFGPDFAGFENGLESLLSRMRVAPGDAQPYTDSSVSLGTGWKPDGDVASIAGDGELDIDVSAYRNGGTLGFVAPAGQGTGGEYAFSVDRKPAGRLTTKGLFPSRPPRPDVTTPYIARVKIPRGARRLHVDVSGVARRAEFYGWHMEAAAPPVIVALRQPRVPSYSAYRTSFHEPDSADVGSLNRAIDRVVARFGDGRVVTADADQLLDADPGYFQADKVHPTRAGHQLLATAAIQAYRDAVRR